MPVGPSFKWLTDMFGSDEKTPNIQQGIDIAKKEMPDMPEPEMYGPYSRWNFDNAYAYVGPFGGIHLSGKNLANQNPQQVADTLTHEMQHVNQYRQEGPGTAFNYWKQASLDQVPYYKRTAEQEAFKAEEARKQKRGERHEILNPVTGQYYNAPRDINLPNPRPEPKTYNEKLRGYQSDINDAAFNLFLAQINDEMAQQGSKKYQTEDTYGTVNSPLKPLKKKGIGPSN